MKIKIIIERDNSMQEIWKGEMKDDVYTETGISMKNLSCFHPDAEIYLTVEEEDEKEDA